MEKWIKNHRDIYNTYKSYSIAIPSAIKTLFKNPESEIENVSNLIEENNNAQVKTTTKTRRYAASDRKKSHRKVDENGNAVKNESFIKNLDLDNQIWRRLSLQSYKKRKQERQEQKSKPLLPAVLRTYDKRGMQTPNPDWL